MASSFFSATSKEKCARKYSSSVAGLNRDIAANESNHSIEKNMTTIDQSLCKCEERFFDVTLQRRSFGRYFQQAESHGESTAIG
jgi:hypothetical protein